ncbi:MAG: OmpA family protein [Hydrogenophilaceae bacterium]
MSLKLSALTISIPLLLAGCAAQQPNQNEALQARVDSLEQEVRTLTGQLQDAIAAQKKIRVFDQEAFSVQLTEDKGLYPINASALSPLDASKVDELVNRLAGLDQEYRLEIQGHTESIGTDDYNYSLGRARAEATVRYLHEKKGIPLDQMSVISFGAGYPLSQDSQGSRRIVIRVLVSK